MQYLENKIICEVERFKSTSFITSGVRIMEDQKVHENKKKLNKYGFETIF